MTILSLIMSVYYNKYGARPEWPGVPDPNGPDPNGPAVHMVF